MITSNGQAQWELTGEIYGGDIRNIAKSPNGTLYAGLQNGSLYRQENGNDYWEEILSGDNYYNNSINNGFPGLLILNDSTLFCSTLKAGLLKSTDGGISWESKNSNGYLHYGNLQVNNSNLIFLLNYSSCAYLAFSTDIGNNWTIVNLDCNAGAYGEIEFADNDSTWIIGSIFGIIVSSDYGSSWEIRNNGLPQNSSAVTSLIVNSDNAIYAGTNDGTYFSSNFGANWAPRNSGIPNNTKVYDLYSKNNSVIYAGMESGVYFTADGGENWSIFNSETNYLKVYKLLSNNDNFLLATPESLFKVNSQISIFYDKGITDLEFSEFYAFKDKIYAATNRGLFYSSDSGTSWTFAEGTRKLEVTDITASENNLFFTRFKDLYYSQSGISYWTHKPFPAVCKTLVASNNKLYGGIYENNPSGPPTWYNLSYSADLGNSWHIQQNPNLLIASIFYLNKDTHKNIYLLGYSNWDYQDYIFRSTNGGDTFVNFNEGLSSHNDFVFYGIVSDSNNNLYLSTSKGLYFRGASDTSWSIRGLQDKDVIATAVDSSGILYLIADNQIYYSDNLGLTFTPFNEGLSSTKLSSIYYNNSSGKLFVGTTKGVYRRTRPNITSVLSDDQEFPKQFQLTSYPNPFNASTKINFSLPQSCFVKITIYNSLGEKVKDILHKEMEAGNHELNFDASDLPSGVYFCKVDSEKYTNTIKLMLVK